MKLIALCNAKNEAWILEKWLQRTQEFADEIIVLDDGSTDETFSMLKANKQVTKILKNETGGAFEVLRNRRRLLSAAQERAADWAIHLDVDEIMDKRLADCRDDLMKESGVGRYYFREITLWRSNKHYRIDHPEKYMRIHHGFPVMVRVTEDLDWIYPWKKFIRMQFEYFRKHKRFRRRIGVWSSLIGIKGGNVDLSDVVKIHYHFVDWDAAVKKHMFYAVRKAIEDRTGPDEIWDVVEWATDRMDETGLQIAAVKPEWGVL